MSLVGNTANANGAPKYHPLATSNATGKQMFANVTPGAFVHGVVAGVFGVSANQAHAAKITPGWTIRRSGTGPVANYRVNTGGTLYANGDAVSVSGGTTNATGTVVTDGNGAVVSVSKNLAGAGFANVAAANLHITSANGTGANVSVLLGGRAGRVTYETLSESSSIHSDGGDAAFPEA